MGKFIYIAFALLIPVSCNNTSGKENVQSPTNTAIQSEIKSNGSKSEEGDAKDSFSFINTFKHDDKETLFTCDNIKLILKAGNRFVLTKKGLEAGAIDLSDAGYDGPGFMMYLFRSEKDKDNEVILIEATADIGTAWYYAIVLSKDKLIDQFYIKEPRTNSETTKIHNFIKIYQDKEGILFRFNKRKIAPYSKIPADLNADGDYVYLIKHVNQEGTGKTRLSLTQPEVIMSVVKDINKDGIEDKIVVYKNTDLKDKYDQEHFGLPIKIYKGTNDGFHLWKENNSIVYNAQGNCVAEGISKIVVKDNYFTIESQTCYDYNILVEGYTTFKVTGNDIHLHKYGEVYFDKSKHDKVIPSKTWTTKDFGTIKFEHTTSDFLEHLRSKKN